MPFFWPQNKPLLQLLCGGVIVLLLVDRVLIFLVPLKLGLAIDSFSMNPGKSFPKQLRVVALGKPKDKSLLIIMIMAFQVQSQSAI